MNCRPVSNRAPLPIWALCEAIQTELFAEVARRIEALDNLTEEETDE